ncbi:MAG: sulfotransferase family 2 domain-containing protein [Chloroflexi bacterium]|nr:sulfotransferase family 2 domain-containing protein [Chloroflexota bacterium]
MTITKEVDKSTTIIFLHIPKTAGLTLYEILNREYGRNYIYTFVGGRQRLQQSMDSFAGQTETERANYRLLRGHTPFGIHNLVPGPATYITFLRDPIKRVVSHYYYVKNNPHHLLHEAVTSQNMSLQMYLSSGINYELDNGQTRQLAGITDEIPYGACDQELLDQAIVNIDRCFSLVGLTERFDASLLIMQRLLGWHKTPLYVRQNVSRSQSARPELSAETRQLIEQYNDLDRALYAYGRTRFTALLKTIGEIEMRRFNQLNRLYYPFGKLQSVIRTNLRKLL